MCMCINIEKQIKQIWQNINSSSTVFVLFLLKLKVGKDDKKTLQLLDLNFLMKH